MASIVEKALFNEFLAARKSVNRWIMQFEKIMKTHAVALKNRPRRKIILVNIFEMRTSTLLLNKESKK
jgi:hypothetical protein